MISKQESVVKFAGVAFGAVLMMTLNSCSSPKPTTPPVVTRISPAEPSEGSNFGAETVVSTAMAKATVVSVNSGSSQVELRRPDGRLSQCKARPGIKDFGNIKVGDEVVVAIGEERSLALGRTKLPDAPPNAGRVRARVPDDMVALAEAIETTTFTGKILMIDQWDRIVSLQMADGTTRPIRPGVAVNLADFNAGDEVSARITEVVVLVVKGNSAK